MYRNNHNNVAHSPSKKPPLNQQNFIRPSPPYDLQNNNNNINNNQFHRPQPQQVRPNNHRRSDSDLSSNNIPNTNSNNQIQSDFNYYKVEEKIGSGSFGNVYKIRDMRYDLLDMNGSTSSNESNSTASASSFLDPLTNPKYLVRKDIKYNHMSPKERQQLIQECKILSSLKHDNIVNFLKIDFDQKFVYIYMEYCDSGDLSQLIQYYKNYNKQHPNNCKWIPEEIIWRVLVQVTLALWRCHYGENCNNIKTIFNQFDKPDNFLKSMAGENEHIIIHRDIKPGNIFLTNVNNRNYDNLLVKLGDFGLAKTLKSKNHFATTYVGTPYYMSPELLKDDPYSPLSDIWSLGCVLYEMCTLHPPFYNAKNFIDLENRIIQGKYNKLDKQRYSKNLRNIIESCIEVDLTKRFNCCDILNDIQSKIMYKSLQLEKWESTLEVYEKELINIEKKLEKKAQRLDRQS